MTKLVRFGVSIDKKLLDRFDRLIISDKYNNRSQAIADLLRDRLIRKDWDLKNKKVAAIISLVYDHHRRELMTKLMSIQHGFQKVIISTQHIHLDHNNCLEIIAVKGKAKEIIKLTQRLRVLKGLKHTAFVRTTSGSGLV